MPETNRSGAELSQVSLMHDTQLTQALRESGTANITDELLAEAADRIDRFDRLSRLLGLLAPGGTAPRTALEQVYAQSANLIVEESPIILDLRHMLEQHWGEWTPALREAEGLPPASTD
jgi:hypothetical protein